MPKAVRADTIQGRIQAWRLKRGYTVYRLAQLSSVDASQIARIEARRQTPGWSVACRIADALGVSVADLRGPDDVPIVNK